MGNRRHSKNKQISKIIGENEKCVFYCKGKKPYGFFGQPNISDSI